MNLQQRLSARRDNQNAAQEHDAPAYETSPTAEALGQVISTQILTDEKRVEQDYNDFIRQNKHAPRSESEFDNWHRQRTLDQKEATSAPAQEKPAYDRAWEVAMHREVQAPTLKDKQPIELPNPKDALQRVTAERQDQAMKKDQDLSLDGRARKLSK